MTEEVQATSLPGMVVETNSATVEQPKTTEPKISKELVSTEPKTDISVFDKEEAPPEEIKEVEAPKAKPERDPEVDRFIEKLRGDELERQLKATQPKETPFATEPNINDKSTWGQYKDGEDNLETFLKAHKEYVKQEARKEYDSETNAAKAADKQREALAKIQAQAAKARTKYPDFDAVMKPAAGVLDRIPVVASFIENNAHGMDVAYELVKNPAILAQMYQNPNIWETGQQLLKMADKIANPAPVKQSNAPDPITPVGSREVLKPSIAQLATKDTAGYIRLMNKRELKQRKGN